MMTGYRAREIRAAERAKDRAVSDEVRAIRAKFLADRELRQRQEAAAARVAAVREQLECLSPDPLQDELAAAEKELAEVTRALNDVSDSDENQGRKKKVN